MIYYCYYFPNREIIGCKPGAFLSDIWMIYKATFYFSSSNSLTRHILVRSKKPPQF